MSSSLLKRSGTASLPTLLAALRAHLIPAPLLNALPTTLQTFAHFQLVSERIKAEAMRALVEHDALLKEMELSAVEVEDQVKMGVLSEKEGRRLKRLVQRDEEDRMLAFSMEFRRHHLAIVFSTPRVPPARARGLIDHYFPDLPFDDPAVRTDHSMLYIRCLRLDQLPTVRAYRKKVLTWYETARARHAKGKRCLTLDDLVGESREDVLETLSRNLIKEAERVIQHVKELEAMFSPSEVDEDEGGTAEAIAEVLPVLDALVNSREAAQGEPQRRISRSPDLRNAQAGSSSSLKLDTRARAAVVLRRATTPPSNRHERCSSSPSPEKIARLPRVSFDMSKGKAKARISIDRPAASPHSSVSSRRSSAHVDMDEMREELPALPAPLPTSRFTPTSMPDSERSSPRTSRSRPSNAASASPANKKRRRSSGFPPRSGPDYTAPSPAFGSNVEKARMKPFEKSEVRRNPDENSPRAEKRTKTERREASEDGESQENSQESGKGIDAGRRDKWKARWVSKPLR